MTLEEYTDIVERQLATTGYITFSTEELQAMTADVATELQKRYGQRTLMMLPPHEVEFMEWLHTTDPDVWKDLWSSGDSLDTNHQPYMVSMAFLNTAAEDGTAGTYHICDLETVDNYYFAPAMLFDKESSPFIDAIQTRFLAQQSLTPAQLLAFEASRGPIDIWHFAWKHKLSLETAKKAVAVLVDDHMLVHVPRTEHLVQYFDMQ